MAQAARLNLRMQKEIKLLLTDPPPGASFPLLSGEDATTSSSLSTIDAYIEGPEGTVYGQGVFKLKIQIPERYPFQPPNVTFATPIYHPNIDNGGRICLDILNLPPKGTWQPSLNISSVLTSIGLLLCEPNPDDGLMCDASREYKYNRQAFDQKARSMTEKFARISASGNCSSSGSIPTNCKTNTVEIGEVKAQEIENHHLGTTEYNQNHGKISFSSQGKLSLEKHLISGQKRDSDKENVGAKHGYNELQPHRDHIDTRESVSTSTKCKKLCLAGKKVEFSGSSQGQKSDQEENMMPNHNNSSLSEEKQKINQSLDKKGDTTKHQGTEESLVSETVIVLDSEDSEEERHGIMKCRLSLAQKRSAVKWKGRV